MPNVELHATNLVNPAHMEWTFDNRLLVSQPTSGSIIDITDGGDMSHATPWATGLDGPGSILPRKSGEVLVAEMWGGSIRDISGGGDVADSSPWMDGLSGPYGLAEVGPDASKRLFVTESYNARDSWVSDITDRTPRRVIDNIPASPSFVGMTPLRSWPSSWQKFAPAGCTNWLTSGIDGQKLYLAISRLGQILDITGEEGDYMALVKDKRAVAWGLNQLGAIKPHPQNGLLYATHPLQGAVMATDPKTPKNYHFDPPAVQGFKYPTCVRFSDDGETMFVCDQADGVVWRVQDFGD